jgi:uncharacterized protein (TIGR00299 family) protein
MKIAYFDCLSGASGDMILGSLLSAGADLSSLRKALSSLELGAIDYSIRQVRKNGISAVKVDVSLNSSSHFHESHHRSLFNIQELINKSRLTDKTKFKVIHIFSRLADAEARVHSITVEKVHFHEVGAIDAIADVVGAVVALESLGIEQVFTSFLSVGKGIVECAHGILPVPAPATLELLKQCPVVWRDVDAEILTPTGTAILTTLTDCYGPPPPMKVIEVGYGAGDRDLPKSPNILRVVIGETISEES